MEGIGEGREGRKMGDGGREEWEKDTSRKGFIFTCKDSENAKSYKVTLCHFGLSLTKFSPP